MICQLDQQYVLPDILVTMVNKGAGNLKIVFTVNLSCHKYNTVLTTTCVAPRNKEEHCLEVNEWAFLPEISVIKC